MRIGGTIALLCCCCLASEAWSQSSTRGMQSAPPGNSLNQTSPRTIDFTQVGRDDPRSANAALGSGNRKIPLQNMPFGARSDEQARVEAAQQRLAMLNNEADNKPNMFQKANQATKNFFQNMKNPFKREQNTDQNKFSLPDNLYRKGNFSQSQQLTDQRSNGFKLPKLKTPQWVQDVNQKTKNMFSRKNNSGNGNQMANRFNEAGQKINQSFSNFAENMNPKNWGSKDPVREINPPSRQANSGLGGSTNRR